MQKAFPSHELLLRRQFCGAFIDDSGTPGIDSRSGHLDPNRKTWVAVLFSVENLATVYEEFPETIRELRVRLGVSEFHAADLLSGKGMLRSVPLGMRLSVFQFLAHIFAKYRYPIFVQTASPQTIADHEEGFLKLGTIGPFDFTSPSDVGLLILIHHLKKYFAAKPSGYRAPCLLVADEGRAKDGSFIRVPRLADFAVNGGIFFRQSVTTFPLQLADFAAFSVNRMQWLLAKDTRTERENTELQILNEADFELINIPKVAVDLQTWSGTDYDAFHDADREAKNLPSRPTRED
jgi:hypothetical protein